MEQKRCKYPPFDILSLALDDGMNIDNWNLEDLTEAVNEFRSTQDNYALMLWEDVNNR
jgi:hypothetical protein